MADATGRKGNAHMLHLSLAEHGKLCLVKGDTPEALRHFREAIRLSVSARAPEVFFRHYTHCVLEALEKSGAYDEVLEYCRRADEHYATVEKTSALLRKDHGTIVERLGVMLLLLDRRNEARDAFTRAIDIAGEGALPLSEALVAWLQRGMLVTVERLRQQQRRHAYFTIDAKHLQPELARALPPDGARAPTMA